MSAASIKPRHRRFMAITLGVAVLAAATGLVLSAFQKNLVFFFTPSQVLAGEAPRERSFRIGGLVEAGSLRREPDGMTVHFTVSDTARRVAVVYRGALPDLFQEGKGVVAQGRLGTQGPAHFIAEQVLAKHDENYMPPEASHAISAARRAALEGGAVRAP